jgi:uncharacterized protein (TIGR02302 family)
VPGIFGKRTSRSTPAKRNDGARPPALGLRLALVRAALVWEAFWPRFWPVMGVAGLFLALALFDLLPLLPSWLHAVVLGAFLIALLTALWRTLAALRLPRREAARRRLEQDSGLRHRPLATLEDHLATSPKDSAAVALWEAHRRRLLNQASTLRVKLPRPGLARFDPLALRLAVLLLLLVGVAVGHRDWLPRIQAAVTPRFAALMPAPPARLDAWINPPAYTALPPLFLGADNGDAGPIRAPVGSTLLAQVQGSGGTPQLQLGNERADFAPVTSGVYKITHELALGDPAVGQPAADDPETGEPAVGEPAAADPAGDRLAIVQDGRTLAEWALEVLPDTAPTIEFLAPPSRTERSVLRLEYGAQDDYGLTGVAAEIGRIDQPEAAPLQVELLLPADGLRDAENASFHDLTPHPWAGLAVNIRLIATDALGQTGRSDVVRTVLPERIFNHPVARALVELRKQLTLAPDDRVPVIRALSQLGQRPEHYFHDPVVTLALRSAERRLLYDRAEEVVPQVQQLLWDTALRIEEGELAIAERDLREIQEALMRALAEGAPEEEINKLIDQLREAMDRFLEALAEQLAEQMAQGGEPQPLPPNAEILQSDELRQMLERARELAQSGARDAARELLAQLQNMLENLQANPLAQMQQGEGQSAWEMMREMEDMLQRQQELLDRSYERAQNGPRPEQRGSPGEGQGEARMQGQGGRPNPNQRDAQSQEELRRQLGEMMRRLGDVLGDIPRPLGRAEQAMREAREALGQEQPLEAIDPQSRALDQLQQGMQSMAEQFMERMGQSQPQRGGGTVGMEPGYGRDPLGRRTGQNGLEALEGVELPSQMELRRAREILNELRRRRGEPERPPLELDYIDRLLRQF